MRSSLCKTIAAFGLAIFTVTTATLQAQDYTYTTNNGTITITKYTGSGGDVTIPETINGLPVTRIWGVWPGAFNGCRNLTSVTIPNNATGIGPGVLWTAPA